MRVMKKLNQSGLVDVYAILFGMSTILLLMALGFGGWAFVERQDYKNNVDQKVAQAIDVALADQKILLDAEAAERAKSPYEQYTTPAEFGSVKIVYPRTWSAHVNESPGASVPVNAYFNPGYVPATNANESFALRLQVSNQTADQLLTNYQSSITQGTAIANAFVAKNVPGASSGWKIDGDIAPNRKGSIVLIPLRDKTISIWTESEAYSADLTNIVLENLTFSP